MSTQLSQSSAVAFPDRPKTGDVGLCVTCQSGDGGCYLEQTLSSSQALLHTRLMLHVESLSGGRIVLTRGLTSDEQEIWRLTLHADDATLTLGWSNGSTAAVQLPAGLTWHCIECMIDTAGHSAALWLNGRQMSSVSSITGLAAMQRLQLGGVFKDSTLTGQLWLDEWVIADQYIGPVVVEPDRDDASDPTRWLAIYNTASPDSISWAEWYRQQRKLPYANLLGLSLASDETIDEAAFNALRSAAADYLTVNGLSQQVLGILCGHGVPGQYARSDGQIESVPGRLYRLDGPSTSQANPLFHFDDPVQLAEANKDGIRLTSRIDGSTLADSQAMTSRALAILQGLGGGSNSQLWLDPVTTGTTTESTQQTMLTWAAGIGRQALRLPMQITLPTDPAGEVSFTSIDHDGFFIGWRASVVPAGFFGEPAGSRIFSMQLDNTTATAGLLRSGASWSKSALEAGYAATAGASRAISISAVPMIGPMFEAIRNGWTLAESWFASLVLLGEGLTLAGDPLMTIPLPQAGWNVYGPFADWSSVRFDTPALMLRDDEIHAALDEQLQPPDGRESLYVVRHIDEQGVEETGVKHVRVMRQADRLLTPPQAMCWPSSAGWRPVCVDDQWRFDVIWPVSASQVSVARVRLFEQIEGESAQQVLEIPVPARSDRVSLTQSISEQSARYQLQAISVDGGVTATNWSAWLRTSSPTTVNLTLLEEGA